MNWYVARWSFWLFLPDEVIFEESPIMPFCNKQLLRPENGAQLQFFLNVSLVVAAWVPQPSMRWNVVLSACEGRGAAGSVSELREAEMKMVFLIDFSGSRFVCWQLSWVPAVGNKPAQTQLKMFFWTRDVTLKTWGGKVGSAAGSLPCGGCF